MENNNITGEQISNKGHTTEHINNIKNEGKRPVSYYDNNLTENGGTLERNNADQECQFEESPTQMHCLSTTVPQNMAAQNIAGKHTPTRNSLRHSRMIVVFRSGQGQEKYLPTIIRYHKLVKTLLVTTTFLGAVLCTLSILLLLWSPNIRSRDNPYWSALPVFLSGIIGLIFLYFIPKEYPRQQPGYWINCTKCLSIMTSATAVAACFAITAFAVVHLIALSMMKCSPPNKVNTSCLCEYNSTEESIFTSSYHYVDLSCIEVNDKLQILIIFISIINTIAGLCEILYLYVHWSSRNTYTYFQVPVNDNSQ